MMTKKNVTQEKMLQAMQDACYSGERSFFEKGDLKVAIVPVEDLEVLEEMDLLGPQREESLE